MKKEKKDFGPWKNFDDCVTEMREKYPEGNARQVCVALKRDLEKEEFTGGFEGCVRHFMGQPDFKAKGGRTREESARALCAYIGRRAGKIASSDYENPEIMKDIVSQFDTEIDEGDKISALVDLVQTLVEKVKTLEERSTPEETSEVSEETEEIREAEVEKAVQKAFETFGFVKVSIPDQPIMNLPVTKSETPLSAEELENLPWAEIHKKAAEVKKTI